MAQPVHLQYNSPSGLYSRETAEEQFQQQVGNVPGVAIPLPAPPPEHHFDPSRSKVLQEIQNETQDTFGQNFAEKIARAETPKLPPQQEPSWASYAREKSERARSRTPKGRELSPEDYRSGSMPYRQVPIGAQDEAREHALKSRTYVHRSSTSPHRNGHAYYEVQQRPLRRRHSGPAHDRGYELGGMDFTKGLHFESDPRTLYWESQRYRSPSHPKPAFCHGGQDYGTGYISHGPYHGHGPDPPRLRPKYTANPNEPINNYVAPNIDAVDPSLLVGDTLSNQKVRSPTPPPDGQFGTSFAPAPGRRFEHRMVRQQPQPPSPVTFSLSSRKAPGRPTAPSHQQDVWRHRQEETAKHVTIATLLNDDVLRVRPMYSTPSWSDRSLKKQEKWKHRSDPRLDRQEIYQTEPNWKRSVDARRNAWEKRAFDTEAKVNLPASAKVQPDPPPQWHNRAQKTHSIWNKAADQQSSQRPAHSPRYQHDPRAQQEAQYDSYGQEAYHQQSSPHQHYPNNLSPVHGQSGYNQQTNLNSRGVETDILNQGFNTNQVEYLRQHQGAVPAALSPGRVTSSSSSQLVDGGQKFTNFTREVSGQPGGPSYSTHEKYESEVRRPDGHSFERSSFSHSEKKSSSTTEGPLQPMLSSWTHDSRNDQQNLQSSNLTSNYRNDTNNFRNDSSNYRNDSSNYRNDTSKFLSDTSNYRNEASNYKNVQQKLTSSNYTSSQKNFYDLHKKTTTTTSSTTQNVPVTTNHSYNYVQILVVYEQFIKQPVYTPPQPAITNYEDYSTTRKEESHKEESRPVSQQSHYSEQKNYSQNYEKKTSEKTNTTTTTQAPIALPAAPAHEGHCSSTYSSNKLTTDAFNRKTEMNESLPRGTVSNTHNNTQGAYRDVKGEDVSYKRELSTATDPNREMALLKEEEKRVTETPLEPGVISRHVTTKYYKKKTTTDTTTTTTPA